MKKTLFVICGPSCSGKTTLLNRLIRQRGQHGAIARVITTTTRPARPGEVDAVDYHFVDQLTFGGMADGGKLLEWIAFQGFLYGISAESLVTATTKSPIAGVVCTPHALPKLRRWCEQNDIDVRAIFVDADPLQLAGRLDERCEAWDVSQPVLRAGLENQATNWRAMWQYDLVLRDVDPDQCVSEVSALLPA